jgi:hypothetical protein
VIIGWAPAADGSASALSYRIAFGIIAGLVFAGFAAYGLLPRWGSERRFDFQRQVHSE